MGLNCVTKNDAGQLVGGWAKIWSLEDKGKYMQASVSTSHKKEDGTYESDFNNPFTHIIGRACEKLKGIGEIPKGGLPIRVLNYETRNPSFDPKTMRIYMNTTILDLMLPEEQPSGNGGMNASANTNSGSATKPAAGNRNGWMNIPDGVEDEGLPFN